ncbi:hypothetical protein [Agromyces ramosus]|uniref:Type III secretion system (T3SS) SseB-like protein n=1 Tax=Agromyces ramosus TaxID=33879 RepID=A0ABU0RA05_9MICO|nr:hypothetical protein [Agromyces ramosus]MDQ0894914.1 hypothetical protein [Agromyces ramosus]
MSDLTAVTRDIVALVEDARVRKSDGMHVTGFLTPDEFWAVVDRGDDEVRRSFAERPVYAVRGWPGRAMISEWSFGGGSGIRSIAFLPAGWNGADYSADEAKPRVDVLVDLTEPRQMVAERIAQGILARSGTPPTLPMPDAPAPDAIIELEVDGIGEPFEMWSDDAGERAAGRIGGVTVVLETVDHPIADIALERVTDLERFIAERRRWIRAQRGED